MQNGGYPSKSALLSKKLRQKVSLCKNHRQQSCKAFVGVQKWFAGDVLFYVQIGRNWPISFKNTNSQSICARSASAVIHSEKIQLENLAVANALQLEATRAKPVFFCFNYDAMPSLTSLNLSIAVLKRFCCWYITLRCDLDLWPLTLNIYSVSPVMCWNSVPNFNAIEQFAAELLRFQYLTL